MTTPITPHNSASTVDLGFALVALGALTVTIATFLPWEESPSYRAIEHNTLIQQGGWIVIALSLAAAASAFGVGSGKTDKWWGPLILIVLCAIFLLIDGSSSETLYPVKLDGEVDTSQPGVTASHGIAIYVAWLGVALMAIGVRVGWSNVRSRQDADEPKAADTSTPTGKATKVRCFNCQHIQQVPVSASTFNCDKCGAKLKRNGATA
jgi:ribosomal protein S27E